MRVDTNDGSQYTGTLQGTDERTGNIRLSSVFFRAADGAMEVMGEATVRGSAIKWVVLPDIIRHAPQLAYVQLADQKHTKAREKKKDKRPRE